MPNRDAPGVRRIPIDTPKGRFEVWTRRVGDDPTARLLLLHEIGALEAAGDIENSRCMDLLVPHLRAARAPTAGGRMAGRRQPRVPDQPADLRLDAGPEPPAERAPHRERR